MRVEPDLVDHPKFIRLKRRVGDYALEAILRIWGHCQMSQRGGFWKGADDEYLEVVARWSGKPKMLFEALVEVGFVHVRKQGLEVHDWDTMNWRTTANWENGRKGGRPRTKEKRDNPDETHGLTTGLTTGVTPLKEGRNEGKNGGVDGSVSARTPSPETPSSAPPPADPTPDACSPSLEEVAAFAAAFPGEPASGAPGPIPADYAERWWSWRANSRPAGFDTILDWRRDLTTRWRRQFRERLATPAAGMTPAQNHENAARPEAPWQKQKRLTELRALIAEHMGNPDNGHGSLEQKDASYRDFLKLKARERALQREIVGLNEDENQGTP